MAKQLKFKKGAAVVKLPLENPGHALVIKITSADPKFAYGSDGNKYHQSNGRCAGRKVLGKKDCIKLPPFGYSAEEEAERTRNIATRNKELEIEESVQQQQRIQQSLIEERKQALEAFKSHKASWNKARRIKTPLGQLRVVVLQFEGQFKGEITHCAILTWIQEHDQTILGYGAVLSGIESKLYPTILPRHFSLEANGSTIPEVIGALILKAKKNH